MSALNRDDVRGHFALTDIGESGEVTGAELGPVLHLWTQGAHLTPFDARLLAEALTWWAERREARDQPVVEVETLLDLIDEEVEQ